MARAEPIHPMRERRRRSRTRGGGAGPATRSVARSSMHLEGEEDGHQRVSPGEAAVRERGSSRPLASE